MSVQTYQSFSLLAITLAMSIAAGTAKAQRATSGAPVPNPEIASGGNSGSGPGADMSPSTSIDVVNAAVAAIPEKIPAGPFAPNWDSLKANYKVPKWFTDAKFGIFMHWGLYSVPAFGGGGASEWYETHLYAGGADPSLAYPEIRPA